MTKRLVECVPNFSDGRSDDFLRTVGDAVERVGARVLDASQDADHNRAVVTFVAPIEEAVGASFAAIELATARIDVTKHEGVHPRIGATDVFPFVPLGDTTIEQCTQLAHALGARVGDELSVPVFFYGAAARLPERRNLPRVRRGGLEGVRDRVRSGDPDDVPDEGPTYAHPTAGFCAIGARPFLVAFNVNLESDDVTAAQEIAREIRASSGGLAGIRALGMRLERAGVVQVSINLCDYRRTGLVRVFDEVARLAGERSIGIRESELVGLAPAQALDEDVARHVRLRDFDPMRCIVERRVEEGGPF